MVLDVMIAIFAFLSFVLLIYSVIILIRRREYESNRVLKGYNVLIFGLFLLSLVVLVKGVGYVYLIFVEEGLIYFDVISTLILLPLVAASFLVGMSIFRSL
ncbi:MAG: hypothetical protein ABIB47_03085 [Candidatus Woesearchaeota archaeon]